MASRSEAAALAKAMDAEGLREVLAKVTRSIHRVQAEIGELEERLREHRATWLARWWQSREEDAAPAEERPVAYALISVVELYPSTSRGRPAPIGDRFCLHVLVLCAASQQYTLSTHSWTKSLEPGRGLAQYAPVPLPAAIRRAAATALNGFAASAKRPYETVCPYGSAEGAPTPNFVACSLLPCSL